MSSSSSRHLLLHVIFLLTSPSSSLHPHSSFFSLSFLLSPPTTTALIDPAVANGATVVVSPANPAMNDPSCTSTSQPLPLNISLPSCSLVAIPCLNCKPPTIVRNHHHDLIPHRHHRGGPHPPWSHLCLHKCETPCQTLVVAYHQPFATSIVAGATVSAPQIAFADDN